MNAMTLKTATEKFAAYLAELDKTPSTIGTAGRILDRLVARLGEDKDLNKIMPAQVGAFFKSGATKKNGEAAAEATAKQVRRVTRQFLVWCVEQGYIAKSPVPKEEAQHGGGVRLPRALETAVQG